MGVPGAGQPIYSFMCSFAPPVRLARWGFGMTVVARNRHGGIGRRADLRPATGLTEMPDIPSHASGLRESDGEGGFSPQDIILPPVPLPPLPFDSKSSWRQSSFVLFHSSLCELVSLFSTLGRKCLSLSLSLYLHPSLSVLTLCIPDRLSFPSW
jgi:hypothetical protein